MSGWVKGQKVIRIPSRFSNYRSVETIEKVTPTGLAVIKGIYYKKDGFERGGDSWRGSMIKEATEDEIKEIQENNYITEVLKRMRDVSEITYSQAVEISKILEMR